MTVAVASEVEIVTPTPEEHFGQVWKLLDEFRHEVLDAAAPSSLEEMIERNKQDAEKGGKSFSVVKEGQFAGAVWFEMIGDGTCIGHLVFDRFALTGPEKMAATKNVLRMMFSDGFRKVHWALFADNRAFRVFLKRLGAEQEAHFRQHCRRDGELVDADIMASFPESIR